MGRIAIAILIFNASVLLLIGFLYVFRKPQERQMDLERFCSELPRESHLEDPFILVNGKWISRGKKNESGKE